MERNAPLVYFLTHLIQHPNPATMLRRLKGVLLFYPSYKPSKNFARMTYFLGLPLLKQVSVKPYEAGHDSSQSRLLVRSDVI